MTIEIANRLTAYRKHFGFSQDELAEKVGVSRQAVSKWERAESSPDTDNLILLSKIYGVSLDELINVDPDYYQEEFENECGESDVSFKNGIHINTKKGGRVDIDFSGIQIEDYKGGNVHIGLSNAHVGDDKHIHFLDENSDNVATNEKGDKFKGLYHFPFPVLCAVIYLLMGFFDVLGGWRYTWLIFLAIPLYYTAIDAIAKKKPECFAYPVLCVLIFLVIGFYLGMWHPSWIIFLTIPLFYGICKAFYKFSN